MEITVNGEPRDVPDQINASGLIDLLGLGGHRIAMEVNQEIVARSDYDGHCINPGDRVEIVRAIGGG